MDFMTARHRVAIAGLVLDGISGKPIAGAHLEITAKPKAFAEQLALLKAAQSVSQTQSKSPDNTRSRSDGLFFFLDLPQGSYTLVGFVPKENAQNIRVSPTKPGQQDPFQLKGDKRYGQAEFEASVTYESEPFGKLT